MDSERRRAWGVDWLAAPGYHQFFEEGWLKGLLSGEGCTPLRSSPSRKVVRWSPAAGVSLIAKIYAPPRFPLSLFRSRGMREYRCLREAEKRGIRTVRAVAVGERRGGPLLRGSYLITEEIPDRVPLSSVRLDELGVRQRRDLVRSVALALRSFHDAGALHRDLHAGNILVTAPAGTEAGAVIIDLHGTRYLPSLGVAERVKNIVQLDTYYGLAASRTDRYSFLLRYAEGLGCDVKSLAARVEKGAVRARWRLWRRRRKRYLRPGKYARRVRIDGCSGRVSPRSDSPALRSILADAPGAYGRGRVIKSSRTNRVASLLTGEGAHIVVKWHRPPTLARKAGSFMRASRGRKAWCSCLGLEERMIGAPEALAYLDRRRLGFVTDSFFIASFLEGGSVLPHFVQERRHRMSVIERRVFCRELGRFLADLHLRGVRHTDLKGSNIMVVGGDGAPRFCLLDPEAVKFSMRISRGSAVENLARLDRYMRSLASATDRLATLSSYLSARGESGLTRLYWKRLGTGEKG